MNTTRQNWNNLHKNPECNTVLTPRHYDTKFLIYSRWINSKQDPDPQWRTAKGHFQSLAQRLTHGHQGNSLSSFIFPGNNCPCFCHCGTQHPTSNLQSELEVWNALHQTAWGKQENVPLWCLAFVKAAGTQTRYSGFRGMFCSNENFSGINSVSLAPNPYSFRASTALACFMPQFLTSKFWLIFITPNNLQFSSTGDSLLFILKSR